MVVPGQGRPLGRVHPSSLCPQAAAGPPELLQFALAQKQVP